MSPTKFSSNKTKKKLKHKSWENIKDEKKYLKMRKNILNNKDTFSRINHNVVFFYKRKMIEK